MCAQAGAAVGGCACGYVVGLCWAHSVRCRRCYCISCWCATHAWDSRGLGLLGSHIMTVSTHLCCESNLGAPSFIIFARTPSCLGELAVAETCCHVAPNTCGWQSECVPGCWCLGECVCFAGSARLRRVVCVCVCFCPSGTRSCWLVCFGFAG